MQTDLDFVRYTSAFHSRRHVYGVTEEAIPEEKFK